MDCGENVAYFEFIIRLYNAWNKVATKILHFTDKKKPPKKNSGDKVMFRQFSQPLQATKN